MDRPLVSHEGSSIAASNRSFKLMFLENKAAALIQNSYMPEPMRESAETLLRNRFKVMRPG